MITLNELNSYATKVKLNCDLSNLDEYIEQFNTKQLNSLKDYVKNTIKHSNNTLSSKRVSNLILKVANNNS